VRFHVAEDNLQPLHSDHNPFLPVDGHATDEAPSRQDVQEDFNRMRREFGIKSVSTKWVKRKYAFGAKGVPEGEADYLKVVYDFHGMLNLLLSAFDSSDRDLPDLPL
jgi:hypothetical protein